MCCCPDALCCLLLLQFRKLAELEAAEAGAICDVVAVVETVADWTIITRKDGTDTKKRSLTMRDDSGRSIEVRCGAHTASGAHGRRTGLAGCCHGWWVCANAVFHTFILYYGSQLTMWGDFAVTPGDELAGVVGSGGRPVLALKSGRVGDFNGKNISTIHSSQVGLCAL